MAKKIKKQKLGFLAENWWWLVLVVGPLLFLGIKLLFALPEIRAEKKAQEEAAEQARIDSVLDAVRQQQAWPIGMPKHLPELGDLPGVSRLSKFDIPVPNLTRDELVDGPMHTWNDIRLMFMIVDHFDPLISQDMYGEIRESRLFYSTMPGYGAFDSAAFFTVFEDQPIIMIRSEGVLEATTDEGVLLVQLDLYHEYIHYLQWRKDPRVETTASLEPWGTIGSNRSRCQEMWQNEREAYFRTCQLANDKGIDYFRDMDYSFALCSRTPDPADFDHALWLLFYNFYGWKPETTECVPVFGREAGHPNPDAFYMTVEKLEEMGLPREIIWDPTGSLNK